MISATKKFEFACAHRLENHEGLCNNVHGHNYTLYVTVRKNGGVNEMCKPTDVGMILDFKKLKTIVNKIAIEPFDHAFVYNLQDTDSVAIAEMLKNQIGQKMLGLDFRTTAENMAQYIMNELNARLREMRLYCCKIELYETSGSYATAESGGDYY